MWLILKIIGGLVLMLILIAGFYIVWGNKHSHYQWCCPQCAHQKLDFISHAHMRSFDGSVITSGWTLWLVCPVCQAYSVYERGETELREWDELPDFVKETIEKKRQEDAPST